MGTSPRGDVGHTSVGTLLVPASGEPEGFDMRRCSTIVSHKVACLALFSLLLASCDQLNDDRTPDVVGHWVSDVSDIHTVTVAGRDYEVLRQSELILSADSSFQDSSLRLDASGNVLGPYSIVSGRFSVSRNV